MIIVEYTDTETNQKVKIELRAGENDTATVSIEADPAFTDSTCDEYGILGSLIEIFAP